MKSLVLSFLVLISFTAIAQEKSRHEKKGDKLVFAYSYDKAIKQYLKADELTLQGKRNLASGYEKTDQHILSADVYRGILNNSQVSAADYYNYAMVQRSLGNYKESAIWMDKFQQLAPNDLRAKSYIAHKSELQTMEMHNTENKVERLDFNTEAQDFGPSYYKNNIAYASGSTHAGFFKRSNNQNGLSYLDIYFAEIKGAQLGEPEKFDRRFNSKFHDGPVAFSRDETYLAYTKNTKHDRTRDKIVELQIWFSTLEDKKWSKPEPFAFNNPEYSVGHPFLTEDGKTMYFVSDMPGGFGKADIYKTTMNQQGDWTKPVNLGNKINTEGDELFPFLEEHNEVLIFASNGHFGLGGLDIFAASMNGAEFSEPMNPGAPVNTKHDDYALIVDQDLKTGYFSSNRDSANDDIYSASFSEGLNTGKRIEGIAQDKNGNPLPGTLVKLLDERGEIIDTVTTQKEGFYSFLADTDKNFKLTGTKEDYQDGQNVANTYGDESLVIANITLFERASSESEDEIPTEFYVDFGKAVVFKPIYFDFNKYEITALASRELDKLIAVMNKNPEMNVELSSYTDCRDSEEYNQELSEKRALATLDYIKKRITKPERITGNGYGENSTVNGCVGEGDIISNCTEDQHSKNRRTEFVVVVIKTNTSSSQ